MGEPMADLLGVTTAAWKAVTMEDLQVVERAVVTVAMSVAPKVAPKVLLMVHCSAETTAILTAAKMVERSAGMMDSRVVVATGLR